MTSNSTQFNSQLLLLIEERTNFEEVKSAVEKDNLFNVKDDKNNTLLHHAAENGNFEVVKYLIESGSKVDEQNNDGETPLILAILNKCEMVAEVLIEAGASISIKDTYDENVLQIILRTDYLIDDISRVCLKILQIDCSNNREKIAKKLFDAGWPLSKVVRLEDVEITKIMFDRGYLTKINVNRFTCGYPRQTPLHIVVRNIDVGNVKLLLEYNANVNAKDCSKRTPLSYIYNEKTEYDGEDDYEEEFENDDDNNVQEHSNGRLDILKLLLERTSTEDIRKHKIGHILKYGNKEAIELLIQSNIDPMFSNRNSCRNKALHMLMRNKNPGVMEPLRNRNFDVDMRNECKETPLMIAAQVGNASTLKFLLEKGANVNAAIRSGVTALFFAIEYKSKEKRMARECVQILLEYGANVQVETDDENETIFDEVLEDKTFLLGDLIVAHLALQEAQGISITQLIRNKIESHDRFKTYFESSKRQLSMQVHESITLLDLLTTTDKMMERHLRNEDMALKFKDFNRTLSDHYYSSNRLRKRLEKINEIVTEKLEAARAICHIMEMSYDRFPLIADNIILYLNLEDMKNLIDAIL